MKRANGKRWVCWMLVMGALSLPGCIVLVESDLEPFCSVLDGYLVQDARYTPDFWGVQAYDDVPVVVIPGFALGVTVEADAGTQPYLYTEVAPDGVLEIGYTGPECGRTGIREIRVYGPDLVLYSAQTTARSTDQEVPAQRESSKLLP